jgi:hypothetical protein
LIPAGQFETDDKELAEAAREHFDKLGRGVAVVETME